MRENEFRDLAVYFYWYRAESAIGSERLNPKYSEDRMCLIPKAKEQTKR